MDRLTMVIDHSDDEQPHLPTCSSCQSERLKPGRIRSAFWQDDQLVVIDDVPALVCDACGERYYDDTTVVMLDRLRGDGFPAAQAVGELRVPVFSFGSLPLSGTQS